MLINNELLKRFNPCSDGLEKFNEYYPNGIEIPKGVKHFEFDNEYEINISWFIKLKLLRDITLKLINPYYSWCECTYDSNGNEVRRKYYDGSWSESTYDDNGNQLTFKNSIGSWEERTYDSMGNQLTYKGGKRE